MGVDDAIGCLVRYAVYQVLILKTVPIFGNPLYAGLFFTLSTFLDENVGTSENLMEHYLMDTVVIDVFYAVWVPSLFIQVYEVVANIYLGVIIGILTYISVFTLADTTTDYVLFIFS